MKDLNKLREHMVNHQIIARGIKDKGIIKAMKEIPRQFFVPENMIYNAYEDNPLPIGESQTISQPYMVALMTEVLKLKGNEKILEIGTGSGYQTAILAYLADHIYTIERIPELTRKAKKNLEKQKIKNVSFRTGDGTCGWKDKTPFDRSIVTAGAPEIPEPLKKQLNNNGLLVVPVGNSFMQTLKIVKRTKDKFSTINSIGCVFVKLIGKHGWKTG